MAPRVMRKAHSFSHLSERRESIQSLMIQLKQVKSPSGTSLNKLIQKRRAELN